MQRLAMDLRMLSRELSLYLEHQVRVGFFGSGVGLSLILGFSVAYACYYLSSIAKVSRGWRRAAGCCRERGSQAQCEAVRPGKVGSPEDRRRAAPERPPGARAGNPTVPAHSPAPWGVPAGRSWERSLDPADLRAAALPGR